MQISNIGLNLIKKYEAFSSVPYICPAGKPTIGYGNTFYPNGQLVKMTDKAITRQEADELLKFVLHKFESGIEKIITSKLNQNQFDAICSFTYNCGLGALEYIENNKKIQTTICKKINANPNDPTIRQEFLRWNKSRGKVLNGLTKRRNEEANLYFT